MHEFKRPLPPIGALVTQDFGPDNVNTWRTPATVVAVVDDYAIMLRREVHRRDEGWHTNYSVELRWWWEREEYVRLLPWVAEDDGTSVRVLARSESLMVVYAAVEDIDGKTYATLRRSRPMGHTLLSIATFYGDTPFHAQQAREYADKTWADATAGTEIDCEVILHFLSGYAWCRGVGRGPKGLYIFVTSRIECAQDLSELQDLLGDFTIFSLGTRDAADPAWCWESAKRTWGRWGLDRCLVRPYAGVGSESVVAVAPSKETAGDPSLSD